MFSPTNVGSGNEVKNIEITKLTLKFLKRPESLIKFVQDRRGNDFRYSLNWDIMSRMGWKSQVKLEEGLRNTVDWYVANERWRAGLT